MKVKTIGIGMIYQSFDLGNLEKKFNEFAETHRIISVDVTIHNDELVYHIFYDEEQVKPESGRKDSLAPDLVTRVTKIEAQLKKIEADKAMVGPTPISVPKNNLVTPTEYNQMMETKKEEAAPETTKNQKRRHGKK